MSIGVWGRYVVSPVIHLKVSNITGENVMEMVVGLHPLLKTVFITKCEDEEKRRMCPGQVSTSQKMKSVENVDNTIKW